LGDGVEVQVTVGGTAVRVAVAANVGAGVGGNGVAVGADAETTVAAGTGEGIAVAAGAGGVLGLHAPSAKIIVATIARIITWCTNFIVLLRKISAIEIAVREPLAWSSRIVKESSSRIVE